MPFALANFVNGGMNWLVYIVSASLLLAVYVTVYAFAVRIHEIRYLEHLVRSLIWINFLFACVGLIIRFTPWYAYMWQLQTQKVGAYSLIRYRMFTYEPAHYAELIAPLVLYAYWQFMQRRNRNNFRLLIAASIPFLMAMSFGLTSTMIIALLVSQVVASRRLRQTKWVVAAVILGTVGYIALPATGGIKTRAESIVVGTDSSEMSRTIYSYVAAFTVVRTTNLWFGAGVGQAKLLMPEIPALGEITIFTRLPCATADTLATFGVVGLALRFLLEGIFFFRGKPYKDPFRLSLFIVVFLTQFWGSFLSNPAEYFAWVIALSGSLNLLPMPVTVPPKRLTFPANAQPA